MTLKNNGTSRGSIPKRWCNGNRKTEWFWWFNAFLFELPLAHTNQYIDRVVKRIWGLIPRPVVLACESLYTLKQPNLCWMNLYVLWIDLQHLQEYILYIFIATCFYEWYANKVYLPGNTSWTQWVFSWLRWRSAVRLHSQLVITQAFCICSIPLTLMKHRLQKLRILHTLWVDCSGSLCNWFHNLRKHYLDLKNLPSPLFMRHYVHVHSSHTRNKFILSVNDAEGRI